jgi:FKBP-type peptidyl-prolyl cis-trans isomerase 2
MTISVRSARRLLLIALGTIGLIFVGCGGDTAEALPTETAEPTAIGDGGMRVASDGDSVLVHYHGTLDDGEVFDSSRERDPLPFVVGSGGVIKGFDDAVRGLAVGDSVTVRIPPVDAYGEVDETRVFDFPIAQAPADIKVGDRVSVGGLPATVVEVTEETVTVDGNHELAGKALTFEIELVEIR